MTRSRASWLGGRALPSHEGRAPSACLPRPEADDTPLGRAITPRVARHPGLAGIHALADAYDAFAARMLLARAAQRTLDVQYYIWHDDMTGTLLLEALHQAAERGVRVRLLLDDNGTSDLDATLAALAQHPHIEVRLFNPFVVRRPKVIGYLTDFKRLNRRMHNKSFTADNQVTILGGRNVGDEYFGATDSVLFADLDVLAVGPVVQEVCADFDRYWNSPPAYPVEQILGAAPAGELGRLARTARRLEGDPKADAYIKVLSQTPLVHQLLQGELPLEWSPASMVSDDPAKTLGQARPEALLTYQLKTVIGEPQAHVDLVSPYFVPTTQGTEAFCALARRGVQVRVLTNALEATDVSAVHSGYARRRKDLLASGVQLFEMRRTGGAMQRNRSLGPFGSSGSSLHAKTFAIDGHSVFVGSFNFDPRSAHLNTELGVVIESPALAQSICQSFDTQIPAGAYHVRLDERGRLYWLEPTTGGTFIRHDREPGASLWQRFAVWILSLLPLESQL
ncbi:phospholipase D family protein [Bordetella holmesii]|uniref:phospholipase D family protein n=1 Tax=Bordetella holmesii TaxID=35814 RepID=UPI001A99B50E|nr:phospholipase D family protein [Bordetella holmesii]MBO1241188.1 phospholipase D family protein [Bordetella holmesii]MBO1242746.1 phospholipase D family protein [Bordetella holmesii]MBO1253380.1 phospholipase D family protein [Bordetella holmesii]